MDIETEILTTPYNAYKKYKNRLVNNKIASFPEFKPVVDYLCKCLLSEKIQILIKKSDILISWYNMLTTKIKFLNINQIDTGNIPYFNNTVVKFPYRETIMIIFNILEFLQTIYEKEAEKIYHFDRYYYLLNMLIENKNIILIPTTKNLTMEDFIYTRHVPIYFVGVSSENIFYDGRVQTPLEFFIHDINHSRRLYYYSFNNKLFDDKIMYNTEIFINTHIKPIIDKNIYIKYILFELFHEYSIPIDKKSIYKEIMRLPGDDSPYEYITSLNYYDNSLEYFKPNTNILSGMNRRKLISDNPHNIVYYNQPYATVFSTVYYKLKYGFYDNDNTVFIKYNEDCYIEAFNIIFDLFELKVTKEHILKCTYDLKRVELFTTKYEDRDESVP